MTNMNFITCGNETYDFYSNGISEPIISMDLEEYSEDPLNTDNFVNNSTVISDDESAGSIEITRELVNASNRKKVTRKRKEYELDDHIVDLTGPLVEKKIHNIVEQNSNKIFSKTYVTDSAEISPLRGDGESPINQGFQEHIVRETQSCVKNQKSKIKYNRNRGKKKLSQNCFSRNINTSKSKINSASNTFSSASKNFKDTDFDESDLEDVEYVKIGNGNNGIKYTYIDESDPDVECVMVKNVNNDTHSSFLINYVCGKVRNTKNNIDSVCIVSDSSNDAIERINDCAEVNFDIEVDKILAAAWKIVIDNPRCLNGNCGCSKAYKLFKNTGIVKYKTVKPYYTIVKPCCGFRDLLYICLQSNSFTV